MSIDRAMEILAFLVDFRDRKPWTGLADDDDARQQIEDARNLLAENGMSAR